MKDKSKLHIRNPYPRLNFPKELTEGESILFGYACREIDEDVERNLLILENVKSIYVQDATGRLWKHNINMEIFRKYLSGDRDSLKINQGVHLEII